MQPAVSKKPRVPWRDIGCGLALFVGLGLFVIGALKVGMYWIAWRETRGLERSANDPKVAEARARKVLDWIELPAGYRPAGALSIPYLVEFAVFTDELPSTRVRTDLFNLSRSFKERGFIFLVTSHFGRPRELQDFVQGKGGQPNWPQGSVDFVYGEPIGQGTVVVSGETRPYSANRGWFDLKSEPAREGIVTLLEINCPDDERARMGVWIGPDPHKGKPVAESDYTGTHADPQEIAVFASHFRFCPEDRRPAR